MARNPSSTMMIVWCLAIVALAKYTQATTTHVVGDSLGWVIPPTGDVAYTTWASTQTFKVGDTLVFNFVDGLHNVVEVTKASYDACDTTNQIGSVVTTSPANINVDKAGEHYYICGVGGAVGHCSFGQKLAINVPAATVAAPAPKTSSPSPSTMSPASVPASAPASVPASAPSTTTTTTTSSPSPSMGTTETISTPIGAPSPMNGGANSAASSLAAVSGFSFTLVLSIAGVFLL